MEVERRARRRLIQSLVNTAPPAERAVFSRVITRRRRRRTTNAQDDAAQADEVSVLVVDAAAAAASSDIDIDLKMQWIVDCGGCYR